PFLEEVPFSTTINASPYRARASRPSAPPKEASRLLLDVASTPPISGGEWRAAQFSHTFYNRALLSVTLVSLLGVTVYAEAPSWVQWLPSNSPALAVLYRMVPSLGGQVAVRRPPRETAVQLAALSLKSPSDTEIIALTAREYEAQLDFTNAEARWKLLDSVSPDHAGSQIQLADYYHRRMQPEQELQALTAAANRSPAIDDPLQPQAQQRAWKLHERAQQLIQAEAMPADRAIQDFEGWTAKYPGSPEVQSRYFAFLLSNGMIARAQQVLNQYERAFPN